MNRNIYTITLTVKQKNRKKRETISTVQETKTSSISPIIIAIYRLLLGSVVINIFTQKISFTTRTTTPITAQNN